MVETNQKEEGKAIMNWSFPEYDRPQRGHAWYVVSSMVVVLLLLYALITVNFLFAVIIIMSAIILLLRERFAPTDIDFIISNKGLKIADKFYPYDLMASFYLIYKPGEVKNLYVEFKSLLRPRLVIPLRENDPLKVRDVLNDYLTEDLDKEEEPASESIRKMLKL